jgi:uncharacterized protein YndB with AHSA1/START domain
MAPITGTIEIARPPQDVFDYVTDLRRQGEWQAAIVDVKVETEGPTRVGTKAVETRRVPGRKETFPFEMTEHDPPRRSSFRVTGGPVRPYGTMNFTPLDTGTRTRVDFEMEFVGHGFGVLLLPLVRRDARRQVPRDLSALKERLESTS